MRKFLENLPFSSNRDPSLEWTILIDHRLVIPLENGQTGKSIDSPENCWLISQTESLGRLAIRLWEILEEVLAEIFLVINVEGIKDQKNFPLEKNQKLFEFYQRR